MTISSQAKVITDFFYGMIPDFEENSGMSLCNICQIVARFIEKQKYLSINTTKPRQAQKPVQAHKPESHTYTYSQPTSNHRKSSPQAAGCMTFLVGILIIVVAIVLISGIL